MTGRPTSYTEALAEEICRRTAEGETLSQICRDEHMPPRRTVVDWVLDDRAGFSARYARARELLLERWADDITEIAEDGRNDWMERETKSGRIVKALNEEAVARSRLRIDSRKWLLSKLKPERYGDSLKLTGKLDMNNTTDEQLDARIAQLIGKAGVDRASGGEGQADQAP
jgi:hypothetical protein